MSTSETLDLVVVGAGPSGLAYALGAQSAAAEAGRSLSLRILEAQPRPGGWVHTRRNGAYALETGPYGYLDKHPELGRIVSALDLGAVRQEPSPAAKNRFVLARGKLRRMPTGPLSFLLSRILTLRGKLRLLREPWAPAHPGGDETVAAFATRRLGPQAAEALVVPMFTGIYAGDPDRASLAACFPRMAELEAGYGGLFRALWNLRKKVKESGQGVGAPRGVLTSFAGGLSTLVTRLAAAFPEGVLRLGTPTERIERDGEGLVVVTPEGALRARRVVLAIPARAAATAVAPLGGPLGELLGGIPYTGVTVVHTAYGGEAARRIPAGFGFLAPRTARRELLGAVFVSAIFPEHAPEGEVLLRNVLGGMLRPELLELEDDEIAARVRAEHRALLGVEAAPTFLEIERYPQSLPQYHVGHLDRVAALERALEAQPGLWITGNALRGIGLADCLAQNYRKARAEFGPPEAPTP